ncbi:MAG: hypothetical protein GY947_10095 [Rhodobacteraceae bacterium]|nr:hypothetical protein [Paracoccaceae bacterium]
MLGGLIRGSFLICLLFALFTGAHTSSAAELDSRVLFTHKRWEVRVVAFEDGGISCVAQVSAPGTSFSIWANGADPAKLQFFSENWDLGDDRADVVVQVDRRTRWDLYDAQLHKNSVLFNLPNDKDGTKFINEVMRGRNVVLSSASGTRVGIWSLSGSSASVRALIECVDLLDHEADGNPFD